MAKKMSKIGPGLAGRAWDKAKNKEQFLQMVRSGTTRLSSFPLKGTGNKIHGALKQRAYDALKRKR